MGTSQLREILEKKTTAVPSSVKIDMKTGVTVACSGLLLFALIYAICGIWARGYPLVDPAATAVWYVVSYLIIFIGILIVLPEIVGHFLTRLRKSTATSVSFETLSKPREAEERYAFYLSGLEELKSAAKIDEETYRRLREEYGKKLKEAIEAAG